MTPTSPITPTSPVTLRTTGPVSPGDRVSVVSPSWAGPEHLPAIFELGLARLRAWGLEPVETPTTRRQGTPAERARDLMAAFADPSTTAVLASIGGDDQIKVLPHLDPKVFLAHPKPFFGYSDNTNLLNWLSNLGIACYQGGSVIVQLGRPGRMHPVTEASLKAALFTRGPFDLPAPTDFGDETGDWVDFDPATEPPMRPAEPWTWHGPSRPVLGPLWGGNLEILSWTLGVGRDLLPNEAYAGRVLLLETSEEMPSADEVYRLFMVMGERGLLQQFAGLVVARPKAWERSTPLALPDRVRYTDDQRAAVLRGLEEYAPECVAVVGIDCGHGDPQVVMPIGGLCGLDPAAGTVTVTY